MFPVQEPPAIEVPHVEPCVSLAIQGGIVSLHETGEAQSWRIAIRVDRVMLGQWDAPHIEAAAVAHARIAEGYGRTYLLGERKGQYQLLTVSPDALQSIPDLEVAARAAGLALCEPT